jgi:hypothetical protein
MRATSVEYSDFWHRTLFSAFAFRLRRLACWKLVASYSSATAPDFHRVPRPMRTCFPPPNLNKMKPLAVTLSAVPFSQTASFCILAKNRVVFCDKRKILARSFGGKSVRLVRAAKACVARCSVPVRRAGARAYRVSWHDCRYINEPNASEEPGGDPLYEPIVDYCIDSRLGPGYSSP